MKNLIFDSVYMPTRKELKAAVTGVLVAQGLGAGDEKKVAAIQT